MERRTLLVLFSILLAGTPTLSQRDDRSEALVSVDVGVILDMRTLVGKMCWTSISMAVDDFYAANRNFTTRLVLHLRDGEASVIGAGSAALGLLNKEGVLAILGPQKSAQARFLSDIADKARVPSISFTATSPFLTSSARSYFVRMAINDSAQVDAVASIVRYYAWREVVIIYEDTDYGNGVIPYLIDALQANSIRVPHRTIKEELLNLKMIQTRVFIVHMSLPVGTRVFSKAKAIGMATKGFAWIVTDGIANLVDSVDHEVISAMQGFVGVKPYVPRTAELEAFIRRWKRKYRNENPEAERIDPSIFSLWAYDSVEVKRFSFEKPRIFGNSTDLDALAMSKMGPTILKAVIETSFTGLSGEFRLVNGQLQSSAYQIVNVVGNGQKGIGFWTPKRGLSPQLGSPTNKDELGAVVWPGDSTSVPRGWEITTGGRRLRFVRFDEDPVTKEKVPTGYSIEIFNNVMKSLPYYVPFDYFPYADSNGTSGSYDLLAFRKDSPLLSDVSKAVVSLSQGPFMDDIEKRWMLTNDTSQCQQPDAGGNRITLHSLRGLFLVTGVVSSLALLVACIGNLLEGYQERRVRPSETTPEGEDEPLADDEQPPVGVGLPAIGPGRDSAALLQDSSERGPSATEILRLDKVTQV
ncbi:unnamed protein product [Spirodela intermedia]|uniref:Receptor ligand binding region domain-containing protein n=1 Tax=Spirodela intermedia TaxID=51605 RepID=A0A7I8JJD9_SPIIN|nr:unnamed protein product [Spirodela intermedia]CAA6670286.1 unnamed protein product [Spirodela intermedia]